MKIMLNYAFIVYKSFIHFIAVVGVWIRFSRCNRQQINKP